MGVAVLLTIGVTLAFPWFQMDALDQQVALLQAKRLASIAREAADLYRPDWVALQVQLARQWPELAAQHGLVGGCPTLVLVDVELWRSSGFRQEAADRLTRDTDQLYFWRIQDEGRLFRFAMAVRGTVADRYPHVLRGMIDVRLPLSPERGAWNSFATFLAGSSGAVLAILVFYIVCQRLILTPVVSLRNVAAQAATGDLEVRSTLHSGDEFQDLSDTLNDMLVHLRDAQEQQKTINRSLDIKLGELAEANVALYESNRLKSEFLANVSHELRTPLVSIIGFAELLRDSWGNPNVESGRLTRYTEHILTSGRSLLDIINDLLDLAKIEAGKMEIHLSEFSLSDLGKDLADFVRPLAEKRSQTLQLEISDGLSRMNSDSGKIKQILYNLLSNAIKFTPDDGLITLRIEALDDRLARLMVQDTGPGIPIDQQNLIFEKFQQVDSSKTREYQGTGLGLAITKELVAVLGGTIGLRSEPGQGAAFWVDLPFVAQAVVTRRKIRLT